MPTIAVTPKSATPGTGFDAVLSGFTPHERLSVYVDGLKYTSPIRCTKSGGASFGIATGSASSLGTHTVVAKVFGKTTVRAQATFVLAQTAPTPDPTPPVDKPVGSLQAAVDAGRVPIGIYHESATVRRSVVFDAGVIFDGDRARTFALVIAASGITLEFKGCTARRFALGNFPNDGVIYPSGSVTDVTLRGPLTIEGDHGSYAGVLLPGLAPSQGDRWLIDGLTFKDCPGPGIRVYGRADASASRNVTVRGCSFVNCSAAAKSQNGATPLDPRYPGYPLANGQTPDAGNESGGLKAAKADDLSVTDCTFDRCNGPALWLDGQNHRNRILRNVIHHGWRAGIMDETSIGTEVAFNEIYEQGWERNQLPMWMPGILVSSSQGSNVHDNIVAWCPAAVSYTNDPNRPDDPGWSGHSLAANAFAGSGVLKTPGSLIVAESGNTQATAAQLAAAGVPTQPEAGHGA